MSPKRSKHSLTSATGHIPRELKTSPSQKTARSKLSRCSRGHRSCQSRNLHGSMVPSAFIAKCEPYLGENRSSLCERPDAKIDECRRDSGGAGHGGDGGRGRV